MSDWIPPEHRLPSPPPEPNQSADAAPAGEPMVQPVQPAPAPYVWAPPPVQPQAVQPEPQPQPFQYGYSYPYSVPPAAPLDRPDQPNFESKPKRTGVRTALIAASVAAVVGGGIGAGTVASLDRGSRTVNSGITVTTATAQNTAKIDGTVTAAAAKIQPSVVTINVAGQNESGTGSGVVVNSDGHILTNNHVISVAGTSGQIQVITSDGQSGTAKIVGTDPSDDLAVIKVDGLKNLTKADFATSSALQIGQTVVAVGAPLGLSNTVTSGIVSNTARPVQTGDSTSSAVFNAIQTDAAINPGNSGGPLVNLNGDVVGINAAIATANSGGVQVPGQTVQSGNIGIGFAIPSDEASRIAAELITTGKATHAILGVKVSSPTQNNSIATTVGATISEITPGSPADKAGLKVKDVVTKVQSQLIVTNTDLVAAIRSYAPEQTITLSYVRAGTTSTVSVKLGTAAS